MKYVLFIFSLLVVQIGRAQEDDFRQVIKTAFFHPRIFQEIFFEYKGDSGVTFLNGYKKGLMTTFILPDSIMREFYPNIVYLMGTAHANERLFLTMTLISHPQGRILVTNHRVDPWIILFVDLDRLTILKKKAWLNFHTTGGGENLDLKKNYVSASCELRKRRKVWKIRNVRIRPLPVSRNFGGIQEDR